MDAQSTSLKNALCGPKYRRATWVCFFIQFFHQFSGIQAINIYANRMLVQMTEQAGSFPLTPLQGTYVLGAVNGVTSVLAVACISFFGRKPILYVGQFAMGFFMMLCGVSVMYEENMMSFIAINFFIASF